MKRILILVAVLLLAGIGSVEATGTVRERLEDYRTASMNYICLKVTTDNSGDVSVTTTNKFTGTVMAYFCNPGTGGDIPTDLFDVSILDETGRDILLGEGVDSLNAITNLDDNQLAGFGGFNGIYKTKLNLVIANGGDEKQMDIYIWIKP